MPNTARDRRVADFWFRMMSRVHAGFLGLTRWRIGSAVGTMPFVTLRTTGRVSGESRTVVLSAPIAEGERIVLVASKGGDDRDPFWYRNLLVHPDVHVTIGGVERPMRARTADGAERAELWPRVVGVYSGYAGYQRKTDREIPLIICEPRTAGDPPTNPTAVGPGAAK